MIRWDFLKTKTAIQALCCEMPWACIQPHIRITQRAGFADEGMRQSLTNAFAANLLVHKHSLHFADVMAQVAQDDSACNFTVAISQKQSPGRGRICAG